MFNNNFIEHYRDSIFPYDADILPISQEKEHIFSRIYFSETHSSSPFSCKHNQLFQSISVSSIQPTPKLQNKQFILLDVLFVPFIIAALLFLKLSKTKIYLFQLFKLFNNSFILNRNFWVTSISIINGILILSMSICFLQDKLVSSESFMILETTIKYLLLYFFIRWMLIIFIGWLMENNLMAQQYILQDIAILFLSGTILGIFQPLVMTLPFTIIVHSILVITLALVLLVRWYEGLKLGFREKNYGLFYFFLYFCTVEILPLLYLIKFLGVM
jgi:hypothetical protein